MADTTSYIPQDLQINLEENKTILPEKSYVSPENKGNDLDLDFDLNINLSDAPKNDERLKTEDQKNNEINDTPIIEAIDTEAMVQQAINEPVNNQTIIEPIRENIPMETNSVEPLLIAVPEEHKEETIVSEAVNEIPTEVTTQETPSTTVEELSNSSNNVIGNIPLESSSLQDDMKIIDELQGHASAGGLAQEAIISPQPISVESPKTFDLDAMLGNPTPPPVEKVVVIPPVGEIPGEKQIPIAVTIPTPITTTQIPVKAIIQTNIPHKKNVGIKVFFFLIMFAGLGFATFFVLKTMYPIEIASIFGGQIQTQGDENNTETEPIDEELTNEELTGIATETELTGIATTTTDEISGTIATETDTHASATGDEVFGDLNNLGVPTVETPENNIGKLTDYIKQGNDFLSQGKAMKDNTIIKYSLYISKKATTFLEDIANGKEINNISGYFAQFDQYITELKTLTEKANPTDTTTSTTSPTNDTQNVTTDSTTTGFGDTTATE